MAEKNHLQEILVDELDYSQNLTDKEILLLIEKAILERGKQSFLSVEEKQQLKTELFNSFRRLDLLSGLLEDEDVSEIMINGSNDVFVEKKGRIIKIQEHFSVDLTKKSL